jgi:thiol:disulfide interchange protein DsbD
VVAALSELAGVDEDIEVFLDRDAFTLDYDPDLVNLEDMYTAIRGLGYEPRLSAGEEVESAIAEAGAAVPEPVATALATAKTEGKLVFLDFYAEWCLACKVLEENTLLDSAVASTLEKLVSLTVDTDLYTPASLHYNIVGMPTLLVLDSDGTEIYRSVGLITPSELNQALNDLLSR